MLPEIIVHTMKYSGGPVLFDNIQMISLDEQYLNEYINIYNECFYEMRYALKIEPYNFYNDINQLKDKIDNIKIFVLDNKLIGSVAIYKNEIDDLIISKKFQNNGYGKRILKYAVSYIQKNNIDNIILHVADWNKKAIALYKNNCFDIVETFKVR